MSKIFYLSRSELRFLRMFEEIQEIQAFPGLELIKEKETAMKCLESLVEKKYIFKNDKEEYALDSTLELIFMVLEKPDTYFIIQNKTVTGNKRGILVFSKDAIIYISDDKEIECMWLPFAPQALGAIVNWIGEDVENNEYKVCWKNCMTGNSDERHYKGLNKLGLMEAITPDIIRMHADAIKEGANT